MAKRRKRRSQKDLTARVMKDIRQKRHAFLRQVSEMLSDTLGFRVKVTVDFREPKEPTPRKPRGGKVDRKTGHVAGYGQEPPADHELKSASELPQEGIPF